MATKILLGSLAASIAQLIEEQHLDESKIRNVVNASLGQLNLEKEGEVKGKAKIKVGNEETPDEFKLTERQVNKFTGGATSALRFFFFNQEMLSLEKTVGVLELSEWPEHIRHWMKKFEPASEEKAA